MYGKIVRRGKRERAIVAMYFEERYERTIIIWNLNYFEHFKRCGKGYFVIVSQIIHHRTRAGVLTFYYYNVSVSTEYRSHMKIMGK